MEEALLEIEMTGCHWKKIMLRKEPKFMQLTPAMSGMSYNDEDDKTHLIRSGTK